MKNYQSQSNQTQSQNLQLINGQKISKEQLNEQVQKLIKNNKKYFSKDKGNEEVFNYVRQLLQQQLGTA
jgi:uncharacterized protein YlzI (FlbEa/FlbD family)